MSNTGRAKFPEFQDRVQQATDYWGLADAYGEVTQALNPWEQYLFALTTTNEVSAQDERQLYASLKHYYPDPVTAEKRFLDNNEKYTERTSDCSKKRNPKGTPDDDDRLYGTNNGCIVRNAIRTVAAGCSTGDCSAWEQVEKDITSCTSIPKVGKRGVPTALSERTCGVPGSGLNLKGCDLARLIHGCQVPVIDRHMIEVVANAKRPDGQDWKGLVAMAKAQIVARDERRGHKLTGLKLKDPAMTYLQRQIQTKPETYRKYKQAAMEMAQEEGHGSEPGRWHVARWLEKTFQTCLYKPGDRRRRTLEQTQEAVKKYLTSTAEVLLEPEVQESVFQSHKKTVLPCPITLAKVAGAGS